MSEAISSESAERRENVAGRLPPGEFSDPVFGRRRMIPIALLLTCLVGLALMHHGLVDYDPSLGFDSGISDTENLLFAPSGGSSISLYIMAGLLFTRRIRIWRTLGQQASLGLAIPALGVGISLAYWSYFSAAADLLLPALFLTVLGLAALIGGRAAVRAIWLPAFFLSFMLMRPGVLVNAAVYPLQMFTAETMVRVLGLIGVEVHRLEDLVLTRDRIFQVIEACSGLRIIETLFMAALLYVELFHRRGRQAALLILLSPVIGLLCNTLRVVTVALNPYSETVGIHSLQGIMVVVVGVLMIAGLDSVTHRYVERPRAKGQRAHSIQVRTKAVEPLPTRRLAVGAALLIVLGAGTWLISSYEAPSERWPMVSQLPGRVGNWKTVKGIAFDEQFMGSVQASDWMRRLYELEGHSVEVFIATDERRNRLVSLRSPKTQRLSAGISVQDRGSLRWSGAEGLIDELLLTGARKRWLALHWERGWDSFRVEAAHAILALDQSPFRRPGRGLVVQIRTPIGPDAEDLHEAEIRLQRFLADFQHAFETLEIPIGADDLRLAEAHQFDGPR